MLHEWSTVHGRGCDKLVSVKQPVLKDVNLLSIILCLIKRHNGHYGPWFDAMTGADLEGGGGEVPSMSVKPLCTPDTLDASIIAFQPNRVQRASSSTSASALKNLRAEKKNNLNLNRRW